MQNIQQIKGIIFDIDGTLIHNGQPLPNTVATIHALRQAGIALRFLSNTTQNTATQLQNKLAKLGFDITADEILTSVDACLHYLKINYANKAGFLALPKATQAQFTHITQDTTQPDFVILGDLEAGFDYPLLNKLFHMINNKAQLITFHKNPYFFRAQQTWLDSGAFTAALEYATNKSAFVTGKPAPYMFTAAVMQMKLDKNEVIVVGDDVLTDRQGANNAGLTSYLVKTGKFKPEQINQHNIDSAYCINSIKDILKIIGLAK